MISPAARTYEGNGDRIVRCTRFFRYPNQLRWLKDELIRRDTPGRRIGIWSCGCCTGQEPYTVAMAALDTLGREAPKRVSIVGTDNKESNIAIAERGVYPRSQVEAELSRAFPDKEKRIAIISRHFDEAGAGLCIKKEVASMVRFEQSDANRERPTSRHETGGFDIVFLNQVLEILMSQLSGAEGLDRKRAALTNIWNSLNPRGVLFIAGQLRESFINEIVCRIGFRLVRSTDREKDGSPEWLYTFAKT